MMDKRQGYRKRDCDERKWDKKKSKCDKDKEKESEEIRKRDRARKKYEGNRF